MEKWFSVVPGGPGIHSKSDFMTNMCNIEQTLSFVPSNSTWLLSKALLCKRCFINSGESSPVVPQEQQSHGWCR